MSAENILVVDDVRVQCIALEEELGQAGYEVDSARSGEEALEMVKSKKYELIFIDLVMPGMDGVETCRAIKMISPDSVLIFMTGQLGGPVDPIFKEAEFVNAGGKDYYLYKPFLAGEILAVTRRALKEREDERTRNKE